MTRLYTRTGDKGKTRLGSGESVGKDDARVEAYGTIDETSVAVGAARVEVLESLPEGKERQFIVDTLDMVQDGLMRLASLLASLDGRGPGISDGDVDELERRIDRAQGWVPEVRHFPIPGSSRPEVVLHGARVVCRRAERRVVALAASSDVPEVAIRFINRMSDLLFILARLCINVRGIAERLWRRR